MLKWHKVGCYATAFAAVDLDDDPNDDNDGNGNDGNVGNDGEATSGQSSIVGTVQQRRERKAQSTHWLVTGAKDGKVSLWDIY